jgi:hypothetical protein
MNEVNQKLKSITNVEETYFLSQHKIQEFGLENLNI